MSFEDDVRLLARAVGHNVADDEAVTVVEFAGWSGYSVYTMMDDWNKFTVRCGDFERTYEAIWDDGLPEPDYIFNEETNGEDQNVTSPDTPGRLSALSAFINDVDFLLRKGKVNA